MELAVHSLSSGRALIECINGYNSILAMNPDLSEIPRTGQESHRCGHRLGYHGLQREKETSERSRRATTVNNFKGAPQTQPTSCTLGTTIEMRRKIMIPFNKTIRVSDEATRPYQYFTIGYMTVASMFVSLNECFQLKLMSKSLYVGR